jgi:hypothetical protein
MGAHAGGRGSVKTDLLSVGSGHHRYLLVDNIEGQNSLTTILRHFEGFLLAPHGATLVMPVRGGPSPYHASACLLSSHPYRLAICSSSPSQCTDGAHGHSDCLCQHDTSSEERYLPSGQLLHALL